MAISRSEQVIQDDRINFEAANLAIFCNEPEKNREILRNCLKKSLTDGNLGSHEFFQGELSFAQNNLPDALKHYEFALKEQPNNSLFLSNYAVALLLTGDSRNAIKVFRQALAQNPNEYHARVGLIAALIEIKRTEHARDLAVQLFHYADFHDVYKFSLVEALVDLEEDRKAMKLVNSLLRRYPGNIYCTAFKLRISSKFKAQRLPGFRLRPQLRALILCDSVRYVGGKVACVGVFDQMNAFAFPAPSPNFFIYLSFSGKRWKSSVEIKILDQAKALVVKQDIKAFNEDLRLTTHVVLNVTPQNLKKPGPYIVEARVDGILVGSTYFLLEKVEPRPDYSAHELAKLLEDPKTVKKVRISFKCSKCSSEYAFQINLDPNAAIELPALPFPDENQFICPKCDTKHELKALKLQARELLGKPMVQPQDGSTAEKTAVDKGLA